MHALLVRFMVAGWVRIIRYARDGWTTPAGMYGDIGGIVGVDDDKADRLTRFVTRCWRIFWRYYGRTKAYGAFPLAAVAS